MKQDEVKSYHRDKSLGINLGERGQKYTVPCVVVDRFCTRIYSSELQEWSHYEQFNRALLKIAKRNLKRLNEKKGGD